MTSWCWIWWTVERNVFVDHGGLPLCAAINCLRSALSTPAKHYIVSRPSCTSICSNLHVITCCFLLLLHPALRTICKCASWVNFWWLQLQRCGGLTGVRVAGVNLPGAHSIKRPVFGSIRIQSHRAEMIAVPWLASVEKVRKMITKNGMSWAIYSKIQVTMEWMTVNLHVLLKILYPTADSYKLQGIPTVPRLAVSRSDVVCLLAGIHWSERQVKFHVW